MFKYYAISLNILHTGGPCRVLGLTAPIILISKKFQSKYICTLNSALCAPVAWAAIEVVLGCLIDMGVTCKSYKTPRLITFRFIFWTPFTNISFCKWGHSISTVTFHKTMQNEYSIFLPFCHFCKRCSCLMPHKLSSQLPFDVAS